MLDYIIQPVRMGGLVKEAAGEWYKIHLHGRLGVITVPKRLVLSDIPLEPGHEVQFYFSYLQINEHPYDYDLAPLCGGGEPAPVLVGAVLTEVNDTAVKAALPQDLGTVAVPRRWVFTDVPLAVGQNAEFYFSPMTVVGKRNIPVESI